jgi:hypothetical protein
MTAQEVYNTYLSVSRGAKNKPWKARKDFEGFDKTENGILCTRLELFFKRFPQINPKDFFFAPYKLYADEDYFDLKFYLSQKAISCYTIVQKQKQEESPDTDNQIWGIIQSVKFVASKLLAEKITFSEYCKRKNGYVYSAVLDYAENNITLYFLLALPGFDTIFDSMPIQDKEIYFKSFYKDIVKFKVRLNNSEKAKKIITESHNRLNQLA